MFTNTKSIEPPSTAPPPSSFQLVAPSSCTHMNIVDLPTEVLSHILFYLPVSSRSTLRRCGSKPLYRFVNSFDRDLIGVPSQRSGKNSGGAAYNAARGELINKIEEERWLSKVRNAQDVSPGPCHLRRITTGDHQQYARTTSRDSDDYVRQRRFYDNAKLIDDHIWVLQSDCYYFEIFDLDTGKAIDLDLKRGPDKWYLDAPEEHMTMLISTYDGRHGMLACGFDLSATKNPHGGWSGPYLTIWDIFSGDVVVSIDLYRPASRVVEVNIVSREKFAVLLTGIDGVELQWHCIPERRSEWHMEGMKQPKPNPDKPGAEPPSHPQCSVAGGCPPYGICDKSRKIDIWRSQKEFWEEQRRMGCREKLSDSAEDEVSSDVKASYESRREYHWWPGKLTLLQSNTIRDTHTRRLSDATMSSDGKGMLVVVVAEKVQVWHVGSMTLLRDLDPYTNYHSEDEDPVSPAYNEERMSLACLSMCTIIHPIEDVFGPGEGSYYAGNHQKEPPTLKRSRRFQGSSNPIDLTNCDSSMELLARFSMLTYDEQRSFERDHNLATGACSPQLDCMVRVVFSISDEAGEACLNRIFHLDISPFHHIRNRERIDSVFDEEEMRENLETYKHVCQGKRRLWSDSSVWYGADHHSGRQCLFTFGWARGGKFDFYEEGAGPSDKNRGDKVDLDIANILAQSGRHTDDDNPEVTELVRKYMDIEQSILQQRSISSLHIDASKLVVCTGYEVAILPFHLSWPEIDGSSGDEWQQKWDFPEDIWDDAHKTHLCDKTFKTWYSFRPLDDLLVRWWNSIRQTARMHHVPSEPFDPYRPNNLHTITADLNSSLEQEHALMEAVRFLHSGPQIERPCISWRYFAMISCALTSDSPEPIYHQLHAFDTLADWKIPSNEEEEILKGGGHDNAIQSGLYFDFKTESSTDESSNDEASNDEGSSYERSSYERSNDEGSNNESSGAELSEDESWHTCNN